MKHPLLCLLTIPTVLAMVALAGGCAAKPKDAAQVQPARPIPANSFALGWSSNLATNGDDLNALYLRKNHLFAYTQSDKVWALTRTGGDIDYVAQPRITGGVLRPPLVLGKYVVYPCGSSLEIFTDRGRPARTLDLDKPTRSAAAGIGNIIYIGLDHTGGSGVLAQIDMTQSYKFDNWNLMSPGPISAAPVIYDKTIYCGSEDGQLYAVTDDRSPIWSLQDNSGNTTHAFQTQGKFVSDIKADDYGVYASNTDSRLYCLNRQTGRIKWQYFSGSPLRTSPVVMKQTVYQFVPGQGIAAIDKTKGTFDRSPKWIAKDAVQFLSEDDQNVYLLGHDHTILAADKQTGQVVFRSQSRSYEMFTENTTDSTIFAATHEGHVVSIHPVLRAGQVGTIVMDLKEEPIASAR